MKYKWKVQSKPTGRYSSFEKWEFPLAFYSNGSIAASISCEDNYYPSDVKIGKHKPLTLRVADYSFTPWKWRTVKGQFKTLKDAKEMFEKILKKFPQISP